MVRESKVQTLTDALTHVDQVATTLSQALTLDFVVGHKGEVVVRAGNRFEWLEGTHIISG